MSKNELKIPTEKVFNDLMKAMQKLADGELTIKDANKIAVKAGKLRRNNYTIEYDNEIDTDNRRSDKNAINSGRGV